MTYREILDHLYALGRFGMKPGLERITALLASLGNPEKKLAVVHVAGTNGKGSTAAFLDSILRAGGAKTGLFTSPHLISFTERFRINGREIDEAEVVSLARRVIAVAPPASTFFELVTAMAFLHFVEHRVDLAVVEVGMGGRYDATNAASGELAVITPIALDHCIWLGDSLAAIAGEKLGVIRPGRPVVSSIQEPEALEVIANSCETVGSQLFFCGRDFDAEWTDEGLAYRGLGMSLSHLTPGIAGRHQAMNAACALAAAELLGRQGLTIDRNSLERGIAAARWPGRMELFDTTPRILLDGAHNPAGSLALAGSLADVPRRRLVLVIGVMGDKDVAAILAPLLPLVHEVFTVTPPLERALPAEDLALRCREFGAGRCSAAGTVADGICRAQEVANPDDLILVCGSLFTVGAARAFLTGREFEAVRG
ncbi:MAG: bifunctional folylpolyglutamate synthase/dihydrofolate synthase [Geobacter sp.]|nr:MAG: bifunctional folylpolyglutamate synthase/dihydrofolate synthase [Geobacter sp.]